MAIKPLEFDPKHRFWAMAANGDLYKLDTETVSVTRPNGSYMPLYLSGGRDGNIRYGMMMHEDRARQLFVVLANQVDVRVLIDTKNLITLISSLTILQSIADEENA